MLSAEPQFKDTLVDEAGGFRLVGLEAELTVHSERGKCGNRAHRLEIGGSGFCVFAGVGSWQHPLPIQPQVKS